MAVTDISGVCALGLLRGAGNAELRQGREKGKDIFFNRALGGGFGEGEEAAKNGACPMLWGAV
ncbi:hypothetical protein [Gymnodinialimonas sp. 57CJ19]|uniref:hypothetical protein n=1 Tax=Gymnodinialimonas sp. 57CJ19 TaxID=3138498 RepID=UPI0031345C62